MAHLGASLQLIEPRSVEIVMPFMEVLTQQHGFIHAGAIGAIADSACNCGWGGKADRPYRRDDDGGDADHTSLPGARLTARALTAPSVTSFFTSGA